MDFPTRFFTHASWSNQSLDFYAFDLLVNDPEVVAALRGSGANAELATFNEEVTPIADQIAVAEFLAGPGVCKERLGLDGTGAGRTELHRPFGHMAKRSVGATVSMRNGRSERSVERRRAHRPHPMGTLGGHWR